MLTRRSWLAGMAGTALRAAPAPSILTHEHVVVDFGGGYDAEEVFRVAKPKLEAIVELGCRRMLECTPNPLGRNPKLLGRLAEASGLEIWSNTGLYGALEHKYLPDYGKQETAEQLAKRWIAEARAGAKFIKIGVNKAPLHAWDRKLVRAAGLTSLETGLTIASHTGGGVAAALEQLELLVNLGVPAQRFVWVHAQNEKDPAQHNQVARLGGWVSFDGVRKESADWHVECVANMALTGWMHRTLISQDAGWYNGVYREYTYLYTDFLPRLDPKWVQWLMWDNPRIAFGTS